jgi:hypothetical protein
MVVLENRRLKSHSFIKLESGVESLSGKLIRGLYADEDDDDDGNYDNDD